MMFGVRRPVAALVLGGLSPNCTTLKSNDGRDRSRPSKAVTGHRTPKVLHQLKLAKEVSNFYRGILVRVGTMCGILTD